MAENRRENVKEKGAIYEASRDPVVYPEMEQESSHRDEHPHFNWGYVRENASSAVQLAVTHNHSLWAAFVRRTPMI